MSILNLLKRKDGRPRKDVYKNFIKVAGNTLYSCKDAEFLFCYRSPSNGDRDKNLYKHSDNTYFIISWNCLQLVSKQEAVSKLCEWINSDNQEYVQMLLLTEFQFFFKKDIQVEREKKLKNILK